MKKRLAGLFPVCKLGTMAFSLLILAGLASCGGGNAEISVNPVTTSILGPAGEMFEVVSKTRTLTVEDNYRFELNVPVTRTAEGSIDNIDWGLEFLDENDEVMVSDEDVFDIDGKNTLEGIKVGEESNLKFRLLENVDGSKVKKITKFRVTSKAKYSGSQSSSSSFDDTFAAEVEVEEVEVASVSSSSSEDWDKILDDYESYCTKVIAAAKKAQAGDVTVMAEYASLLESAQSLQSKLDKAGSELTAAQLARLNKIATKMASAAM